MFGMRGGRKGSGGGKRRKRSGSSSRDDALKDMAAGSEIIVTPGQPRPLAITPAGKTENLPHAAACEGRGLAVNIRWLIRRDMDDVLHIERHSFEHPWTDDDFIRALRQRNCIGMVAECRTTERILGFMIYELNKSSLRLLSMAVHPDYRRQGIGRVMIDKLRQRLDVQRRSMLETEVRETNLDAQLFLRRLGFRAENVLFDYYADWGVSEDAYVFRWRHGWSDGPAVVGSVGVMGVMLGGMGAAAFGGRLAGLFGKQDQE